MELSNDVSYSSQVKKRAILPLDSVVNVSTSKNLHKVFFFLKFGARVETWNDIVWHIGAGKYVIKKWFNLEREYFKSKTLLLQVIG